MMVRNNYVISHNRVSGKEQINTLRYVNVFYVHKTMYLLSINNTVIIIAWIHGSTVSK